MHPRVRCGLLVLSAIAILAAARASHAQAPATSKADTPAASKTVSAAPTTPPNFTQPIAIVNGETITRGDLITFLSSYQIPAGNEEQVYKDAVESLVNARLINQFLTRQKIPVSEDKISEQIASLEKQLKERGSDLPSEILHSGMSMPEIRKQYANRIRWVEFLNEKARDAELKKFFATHKDLFSGTQVKASHILLKVEPKATTEEKAKSRDKLLAIKKDIVDKKTTFAEAANKLSEDPANSEGAGGDIGYFNLNGTVIEEFAIPAFALKKGDISDPVETPYGLHLITVTDRKEGTPIDFEQNKPLVKRVFESDLQKTLLIAERKIAKVEIKPMPADLFQTAPAPAATPFKPETAK